MGHFMTRSLCWALLLAMCLTGVTVFSRPLLPLDETRYLSVAWEAHHRGDFLVSHLNGETYAHKPPLLFWLINAVWQITGVTVTPARLVAPAAAIGCLLVTHLLARRLWPDSSSTAECAPLILVSSMLWMVLSPLTMFDTLITLASLCALLGVARAADGSFWSGWILAGIAMGFGILSKGPVILVHVLPTALAAPWWAEEWRQRKARWFMGMGVAICLAAAIGLSWALPSANAGGTAYANELLFGQTAGRMVDSFAHREPFWWYLPWLPLCLLPWLLFVPIWRGVRVVPLDRGLKFVLVAAIGTLLIMSLVSGKQIHYLVPLLPHGALALSRFATRSNHDGVTRRDQLVPALGTILMGVMPIIFNHFHPFNTHSLVGLVADGFSIPLILCGLALLIRPLQSLQSAVTSIASLAVVFMCVTVFAMSQTLWSGFDLEPLAGIVRQTDRPVAWFGGYHGQINFVGRILRVEKCPKEESLRDWINTNPDGVVVIRLPSSNDTWNEIRPVLRQIDRAVPTETEQQFLRSYFANHKEFPLAEHSPKILYVQWIRSGLYDSPHLVVSYEQ